MNPLFKVGEEVILQAKNCQEYNGNHIVSNVKHCEDVHLKDGSIYSGFYYNLEGVPYTWVEYVLKKKYRPSEFTFEQLMNSLNLEMVK